MKSSGSIASAVIWSAAPLWGGVASALDVETPGSAAYVVEWDRVDFSHDLWDAFVKDRVDENGLVDYVGAKNDERLREYLYRLAHTAPAELTSSDAKKAFWINAYNALVIRGVLELWPDDRRRQATFSVIDQPLEQLPPNKGFFRGLKFMVGGQRYTLDEIESRVLLRDGKDIDASKRAAYNAVAPDVADPRIHFALVCGAKGCPRLRRQAFSPDNLEGQLAQVTRDFFADSDQSRFDRADRRWHVSELMGWYEADFVAPDHRPRADTVMGFAAMHVADPSLAASLRNDRWRVEPIQYVWSLNNQD